MSGRIAKEVAYAGLAAAANDVIRAGGQDGRTSPADMKRLLEKRSGAAEMATKEFYEAVKKSDKSPSSKVTWKKVLAVEEKLSKKVDKLDANNDGLSKKELEKAPAVIRFAIEAELAEQRELFETPKGVRITKKEVQVDAAKCHGKTILVPEDRPLTINFPFDGTSGSQWEKVNTSPELGASIESKANLHPGRLVPGRQTFHWFKPDQTLRGHTYEVELELRKIGETREEPALDRCVIRFEIV